MANEQDLKSQLISAGHKECKLVVFTVAQSVYGATIEQVREIINANLSVVPVPDALPAIEGAINLRGKIIPLINLAKYFMAETTKIERIIISEFARGFFSFGVSDVAKLHVIPVGDIERPSDLLTTKAGYVVAIVKIEGRVVYILDLERVARNIHAA